MIQKLFSASMLAGGAALCLSPMASAQYAYHGSDYGYSHSDSGYYQGQEPVRYNTKCKRETGENRVAGAVVGAIAGGLIGSAIGENADDNHDARRNRGYRGYRGNRGYRGYRRHGRDTDDGQIAGALLGAVIGGVAGSEIAASSTDCHEAQVPGEYRYGEIPPPNRRTQTVSRDYGYTQTAPQPVTTTRTVRTVRVQEDPLYGGPTTDTRRVVRTTTPAPAPVYQPACQTVQRETRLPDGSIVREPVSVCQDSNGRWEFTDGTARY